MTLLGSRSGTPAAFVAISAVTSATTVTSRHAAAPRQAGALAPRSGAWKRGRSGIGPNTVAARARLPGGYGQRREGHDTQPLPGRRPQPCLPRRSPLRTAWPGSRRRWRRSSTRASRRASSSAPTSPTRAVALADEIAAAEPDVIGLQEAAVWRARARRSRPTTSTLLEAELERRGLRYRRVAVKENGSVELPSAAGILRRAHGPRGAARARGARRLERRRPAASPTRSQIETRAGVVLARARLDRGRRRPASPLRHHPPRGRDARRRPRRSGCRRRSCSRAPPTPSCRSCCSATSTRARHARRTSTCAQAGFDDAWTRANPDGPAGLTCCHAQPLDNPEDTLRTRIDLILTRGLAGDRGVRGRGVRCGLWASDHQGVVADLVLTGS